MLAPASSPGAFTGPARRQLSERPRTPSRSGAGTAARRALAGARSVHGSIAASTTRASPGSAKASSPTLNGRRRGRSAVPGRPAAARRACRCVRAGRAPSPQARAGGRRSPRVRRRGERGDGSSATTARPGRPTAQGRHPGPGSAGSCRDRPGGASRGPGRHPGGAGTRPGTHSDSSCSSAGSGPSVGTFSLNHTSPPVVATRRTIDQGASLWTRGAPVADRPSRARIWVVQPSMSSRQRSASAGRTQAGVGSTSMAGSLGRSGPTVRGHESGADGGIARYHRLVGGPSLGT